MTFDDEWYPWDPADGYYVPIQSPDSTKEDSSTPVETVQTSEIRMFETGATRDRDDTKPDPEGFLSPTVIMAYCDYMHRHRTQVDGKLRDSDNWQKGIPLNSYMKSMLRHVLDLWLEHRGSLSREGINDALCGILFNAQGYLHEVLKEGK